MSDSVSDSQEIRIREDERRKLWERSLEKKLDHIQDDVAEMKDSIAGDGQRPGLIGGYRDLSTRVVALEERISSILKWVAGISGALIVAAVLYLFTGK